MLTTAVAVPAAAIYHQPPEEPAPPEEDEADVEIVIEGSEFKLEPNAIWIPEPGVKVRIIFVNVGRVTHALSIEGVGSTPLIGPGEEASITFTAGEAGVLEIWCPVGDHRRRGMEGVIVIGLPEELTVTITETVETTVTTTTTIVTTTTDVITQTETVTETRVETVTETVEVGQPLTAGLAAAVALVVGLLAGYAVARSRG